MHKFIATISEGENFEDVYYLEKIFQRKASNGNDYNELVLRDKTGSKTALYWNNALKDSKQSDFNGKFVHVKCSAKEYHGSVSLIVNEWNVTSEPETMDDYLPSYDAETVKKAKSTFTEFLAKLSSKFPENTKCHILSRFIDNLYSNPKVTQLFYSVPSSTGLHYGRVGGCVQRTVDEVKMLAQSIKVYGLSQDEASVAMCAAAVSNVGDIYSYEFKNCVASETLELEMYGGAALTYRLLNGIAAKTKKQLADAGIQFDSDILMRFMHCVMAANGYVTPITKEAIALHFLKKTHMQSIDCFDFIDSDTSEDIFTAYDAVHGRHYYRGE